jgi:retinol-binding protein 3
MKILTVLFLLTFTVLYSGLSQNDGIIDSRAKKEIVYKLASIMENKYLDANVGEEMSKHIVNNYNNGEYKSLISVRSFCTRLTSDLRYICNDKHVWVFHSPEEAYEVKAYHKLLPEDEIMKIEKQIFNIERKDNFGYSKIEILEGNVGLLQLDYFASPDIFNKKLAAAMLFLENTDAIILDFRKNPGGEGSSLLSSYFLPPEKTYLGRINCRDTSQNIEIYSNTELPGKRMIDKDLYILTSNEVTFSAAEGVAYELKHLNRAVIIGETT